MESFLAKYFFDLTSFHFPHLFRDGKNVWDILARLEDFLKSIPLGSIEGEIDPRAVLINKEAISIGKGTIVEPGAFIRGPCVIGKQCEVRQGAYIRGNFLAGDECVIGHATEVKNSIFLNRAQAGHFAYIGDTILGNSVNLGAGTKCANLRLDRKPVSFIYKETKIRTGLRKFGAIFGDGSQTGCNAVTNPGTILGKKTYVFPGVDVSGFIPENTKVKRR